MTDSHETNVTLNSEALDEHARQAGLEETSQQSQVENADMENEKVTVFEQKSSKAEVIERLKELSRDIDNTF